MACLLTYCCERFEPRSLFISRLSMTVPVIVFLNRTVVDSDCHWHFDNLCGRHCQQQSYSGPRLPGRSCSIYSLIMLKTLLSLRLFLSSSHECASTLTSDCFLQLLGVKDFQTFYFWYSVEKPGPPDQIEVCILRAKLLLLVEICGCWWCRGK